MRLILKHNFNSDPSYQSEVILPISCENKEKALLDLKNDFSLWVKNNLNLLLEYNNLKKNFSEEILKEDNDKKINEIIDNSENILNEINKHYFLNNKKITPFFLVSEYYMIKAIEESSIKDKKEIIKNLINLYSEPIILTLDEFFDEIN